jgi:putative oxidoreductase
MKNLNRPDLGILIIRILIGGFMLAHGITSLMNGKSSWEWMGNTMAHVGIPWQPVYWGFAAVLVQTFGGLFFMLGFFFRWTCLALSVVMAFAFFRHLMDNENLLMAGGQAFVFTSIFLGFLFIGAGSHTPSKVH